MRLHELARARTPRAYNSVCVCVWDVCDVSVCVCLFRLAYVKQFQQDRHSAHRAHQTVEPTQKRGANARAHSAEENSLLLILRAVGPRALCASAERARIGETRTTHAIIAK